jgi:hypothetical protein
VRRVTFRGVPKGLDGQALAWSPLPALAKYPMPPADRPVVAALIQPDRYLVTPAPVDDDDAWLGSVAYALAGGVRRVQLRAPGLDALRWNGLAARAVAEGDWPNRTVADFARERTDAHPDRVQLIDGDHHLTCAELFLRAQHLAGYFLSIGLRPGDVVTWMLPGNLPHIGIVTDRKTPDGVPLVVHNIGRGPVVEDVLFAYTITGRYRYGGP